MNIYKGISYFLLLLFFTSSFHACKENPKELPIFGLRYKEDGVEKIQKIPDFSFTNQFGKTVTNADYENKIYVADFFFTSCPTICPKIKQQELRIQERFKEESRLLFLSHTIDPKYDTIERLKKFSDGLGVNHSKWNFVTGPKEIIYEIDEAYLSIAMENADAPGGFDHSNRIILVDQNRQVRSHAIGTDPEEIDRFMEDIQTLLDEN